MRNFLLGIVVALAALAAGGYWYFASGAAPVATAAKPMPFEKRLAHLALHAQLERQMPRSVPVGATESTYMAAVPAYREHCAVCHGLPGQPATAIAQGMFPAPPQLLHGTGVSDDPAGETYWKVTNGIRMTGMPAFSGTLSDAARWQISVMLANSDKLTPPVLELLTPPLPRE